MEAPGIEPGSDGSLRNLSTGLAFLLFLFGERRKARLSPNQPETFLSDGASGGPHHAASLAVA